MCHMLMLFVSRDVLKRMVLLCKAAVEPQCGLLLWILGILMLSKSLPSCSGVEVQAKAVILSGAYIATDMSKMSKMDNKLHHESE
ncbi:unnamed protein product [Ilex paraguariensis]|uniref:Uncharacterized protein n=1 Tax=Ilex paraguariensis TaxID=185542 RepID=A0ABC8UC47_9AQUA